MSEILEAANEVAEALHRVGAMDKVTLRRVQALSLPPQRTFTAEDIQRIRAHVRVSQAVFAQALGVGKTTVQQWEQGIKKPSGPARRLLDLMDRTGLEAFT